MDLTNALNFIENRRGESYKIGVVDLELVNLILYKKGDVIVFRNGNPHKKALFHIPHENDSRTLTIETPYSPESIQNHISSSISIFSYNIVSGVPLECIREIRNLDDL